MNRILMSFNVCLIVLDKVYKGKVLMVTEYGPGVDPGLHSYQPERFDFSQEYGLVYHKHYLREMMNVRLLPVPVCGI